MATAPPTPTVARALASAPIIRAAPVASCQTTTAATSITLPTTGTLATLTGAETLTNKTLTLPKINENVEVTATATELNYVDGVTSAIQTQINTKAPSAAPTFTGTVVLPGTTSIGDVSSTTAQVSLGLRFRFVPNSALTQTLSATLTVIGNESGGSVTIPVSVNVKGTTSS